MNLVLGLGLLLAGILTAQGLLQPSQSPNSHATTGQDRELKERRNARKLARHNMQFGFKLLKKLSARSPRQNIFFSPMSISTAFSMLSLGAQDSTLAEIKQGFNFKEMSDKDQHQGFHYLLHRLKQESQDIRLDLGNTLFIDQRLQLQQKFLRAAKSMYDAETVPTNFQNLDASQREINDYVSQKTHGRIRNLIRNIDPGTVMLLTNYIFFRGKAWGVLLGEYRVTRRWIGSLGWPFAYSVSLNSYVSIC
jgi:serpin peptidase inhibitor clade A protein 3